MKSLRLRLFVVLLAATALVWSVAAAWTFLSTRADVQRVLDRRLVEAAGMVASLAQGSGGAISGRVPAAPVASASGYHRQLSCQVWTLDWRLVGRSGSAPRQPLAQGRPGFSERTVSGERWRVYTLVDPQLGLRILVGDNLEVRSNLIGDVMRGLLLPALVGVLGLAFALWAAIGHGLRPLREVARELGERSPSDHGPLVTGGSTHELRPVVDAINDLFLRLEQMRANERHFIASAAHELQTPLAGLRAHAQIAMTGDAERRDHSLRAIQESVDRTSRLVQQLLDLSREEAEAEPLAPRWLPLSPVTKSIAADFAALLTTRQVELNVEPSAVDAEIYMDEPSLLLSLRNLVRNAVQHAPGGTAVRIGTASSARGDAVLVSDEGPGIPASELLQVRDRFVRGSRAKGEGSGLGLSIVDLVLRRNGGSLDLTNRPEGGFRAEMRFPAGTLRRRAAQATP